MFVLFDTFAPAFSPDPALQRRTIGERLDPTIANAVRERAQYASKG